MAHTGADFGAVFDAHVKAEFVDLDVDAAMEMMTANPYLTHLPGVAPTGRFVEMALAVVVDFEDGKVSAERISWVR